VAQRTPVPDRAAHQWIVIAGQHDHRQPRRGEDGTGALQDRRVQPVMFEDVAGQQNDIGLNRLCCLQYGGQARVSITAPGARGIVVIDVSELCTIRTSSWLGVRGIGSSWGS
jgi:hypothetical protein